MPPQLRELHFLEQVRVCRLLTRGEAPNDPKLAAVTLDAAEWYRGHGRALTELYRWLPAVLALSLIVSTLPGALKGQIGMVIFLFVVLLGLFVNLTLNPWARPKNVDRSLDASRKVVASRKN